MKDQQDSLANKTDSDAAPEEDNGFCVYEHGFKIYHCALAFYDHEDCVYCLCNGCYNDLTSIGTAKKLTGRSKRQKTSKKVCDHDLHQLKMEDNDKQLARKSPAQQGKNIPKKCENCRKLL